MLVWLEMLILLYNVKFGVVINYIIERSFNFGSFNFVFLILYLYEFFYIDIDICVCIYIYICFVVNFFFRLENLKLCYYLVLCIKERLVLYNGGCELGNVKIENFFF